MPQRREGEPEYVPLSEQSLIKKAARLEFGNPFVDAAIRAVLVVALGGGAATLTSEKKSIDVTHLEGELATAKAALEEARKDVDEIKADQKQKWQRYYSNRRAAQNDHVCYERRFSRLEARASIEAPTCFHQAEDEMPAAPSPPNQ